MYQKKEHEKCGKWLYPRPILSITHAARSLNVPGRRGREVTVAFEDASPAFQPKSFAHILQEDNDVLGELPIEAPGTLGEANPPNSAESSAAADADLSSGSAQAEPCKGDKVPVLWPFDREYYSGTIESP